MYLDIPTNLICYEYLCTQQFSDLIQTAANSTSTEPYPIDLYDLGFDGTWEQFCDEEEIDKMYPEFLEHDLTRMRTTICISRKSGKKPDDRQLKTIVFYKYCTAVSTYVASNILTYLFLSFVKSLKSVTLYRCRTTCQCVLTFTFLDETQI